MSPKPMREWDGDARETQTQEEQSALSTARTFARRLAEREEWLAEAFVAAGEGLWELHVPSGRLICSPRWAQMLGYGAGETPSTIDGWMELVHPDDRAVVEYYIESHLRARLPALEVEYRAASSQGPWRWVEARGRIVERTEDGYGVRLMGTTTDVTERRHLEIERDCLIDETERSRRELELANERLRTRSTELEARSAALLREFEAHERSLAREQSARHDADVARRLAEEANKAKSKFMSMMSHELRTPLNAIIGYTELVELGVYGPVTTQQVSALNRVRTSAQHLLSVINDVLNYARADAGTMAYRLSVVRLTDLVVDLDALFAPQLTAAGLHYEVLPCECPPDTLVRADVEKARQVLLNLLTNAVKFTPSGGSVRVSCGVEGAMGWLCVTDTGRGIAPDKLQMIFEPFVQIDRESLVLRPTIQQGVGLGLAISRELARGMKGDITAESDTGLGAAFTLWLPLAPATEHPA